MLEGWTGRIVLLAGWRRALLAVLAGLLLTLGLAPVNLPLVGFLSFPVLVLLLDGASGVPGRSLLRRLLPAFRIGWCFGFGYFVGGLWWLGAAMTVDGDAFLWAIPFAVLGLPAVLAVYYGLAAMLARAFWSDGPSRILALAAAFAVIEVLRGRLFTGFPWNELGVLAAPVPLLAQSLAVVGLHGLTLLAVIVFAAPAALAARHGGAFAAVAILLLSAHVGFGAWRLSAAGADVVPNVRLRVVQPNIDQSEKWDANEAERNFDRLLRLSQAPEPQEAGTTGDRGRTMIVWPESAFPFFLTQRPDAVARLSDVIAPGEILLAGAVRPEVLPGFEPRYFNSVYAIDDNGEIVDARDKRHLVPFGEYIPFEVFLRDRLGLRQLAEMPGGFSAGATREPFVLPGLPPLLSLICYEIIFQDEVDIARGGRPGAILNVTNDAWYGHTPGPYQHLRQAELTATALGLPLVRAANTGISVVNDAYGRVVDGLALGAAGTIEAPLPAPLPPTLFARHGNLAFWCATAFLALLSVLAARRDTRRN